MPATARQVRSAAHLIVVSGPPCSGKTTHVTQHKRAGDLVLDYDAIAQALGSDHTHAHPPELLPFVHHTIDACLDRLARQVRQRAWLIRCDPTTWDLAAAREHVVMDTPMDVCLARAHAAGRPPRWDHMIRHWFDVSNRTQGTS